MDSKKYTQGEKITEGKTKALYNIKEDDLLVLVVNKDSITAFNGERADTLQGKAEISNLTNSHIYSYLNDIGIKTSFVERLDSVQFLARKCHMIPIECVARRVATGSFLRRNPGVEEGFRFKPLKLETFLKDDEQNDPQWSQEQILESSLQVGDSERKITKAEYDIMMMTTKTVFEVLERAWASMGCTLVDMKVEFGIDSASGEILLSDVIDSDSWRLWPSGDKRLMKDKQVYRNLSTVTPEALQMVKANFMWIEEKLRNISKSPSGTVVIMMGSRSDQDHCSSIKSHCEKFGIKTIMRVSSAHKSTESTLSILAQYEDIGEPVVFIAVAGRSNGLGPVLSGNTNFPVINCPPFQSQKGDSADIWSSVRTPSGLGCSTVIYPEAAALQAAAILGLNNHVIWSKLRARLLNNCTKILLDDADLQYH